MEINELKSLKNPPNAVKLLMEGVCLVMGIEPVKYKAKDGVTVIKDYWTAAVGKNVLGNPRLVELLTAFDSSSITPVTMASLEELYQNPEFIADTIQKASKAGKGKNILSFIPFVFRSVPLAQCCEDLLLCLSGDNTKKRCTFLRLKVNDRKRKGNQEKVTRTSRFTKELRVP